MRWNPLCQVLTMAVAGMMFVGGLPDRADADEGVQPATLRLAGLIQESLARNPEIQAARKQWEAVGHRIRQVQSLDDPILSVQLWNFPQTFNVTQTQNSIFGLSQSFPFPGKLDLKGEVASRSAEMAEQALHAKERELVARLKQAYYDLFLTHKAIQIHHEQVELLGQFVETTTAKFRAGKGSQADVLKAQVELSLLFQHLPVLEQRRKTAEAMLNTLLDRDSTSPLGVPQEPPQIPLDRTLDDLHRLALNDRPELKAAELAVQRNEQARALAQRQYYPDFNVAFQRFQNFQANDGFGAYVAMSIPFAFWTKPKYDAGVQEAAAAVSAARAQQHTLENLTRFQINDLLATQDEYLLAVRTQGQLAASPLAEVKANAAALVAGSRERLHLWDVTDRQIVALERRGKAEPVLTVYAPSSGIVLKREALPGKYVEPGTTLYEVADLSTVWISADLYESEMAATKLGQPASVTFAAYPGTTFPARVAYIYPSVNTDARTVRVRVELPNPGLKLKPGMYGNVTLQTDAVHTLVVPKEAVLETGLRQLVFLDRGQGRYEPASVKLGRRNQDDVEVLEGLKEGDRIVTSANFLLDAESKLASASSMQAMMGRIGMADWQMRGAYEAKMEGMDMGKERVSASPGREGEKGGMGDMKSMEMEGMKGMEGMQGMQGMGGMPGMEMGSKKGMTGAETRQMNGLTLSLTTAPEKPKAGEVLVRLKVTDQAGKPVTNAQVLFVYTMPMPGMVDSKATARHTKEGLYEGKVMFGMGGTWVVTVNVTVPGRPPIAEQFQFSVAGGGM